MTVSTRCTCWLLHRADGLRQGFTDHDEVLEIEGVRCEAIAAFDASEARTTLGLGADAQDVAGALAHPSLKEEDIVAGRYDGAEITVWSVDWQDPERRRLQRRATLGEITRRDGAFTAELRGLSHKLDETNVRRFARTCDAQLGDARCGANLAPFTLEAEIVADGADLLRCEAARGFPDDWFAHGTLRFIEGENAEVEIEIASHLGARLHLWRRPPFPIEDGVRVRLVAGCDKRFTTCRTRFGNAVNYRGFPHMPGGDFTLGYAAGGTVHDGGALVE